MEALDKSLSKEPSNSSSQRLLKRMSDTLQLVVNVPFTQHHKNNSTFQALNECPIRFSLSSTLPTFNATGTTQHSKRSTNVRYASACRQRAFHSTPQEQLSIQALNECPIRFSLSLSCRITQTPRNCSSGCPICFSLSVTFPTLNSTGATQHSIGHSLRLSMVAFFLCGECPEPHRQAEAYRTFA